MSLAPIVCRPHAHIFAVEIPGRPCLCGRVVWAPPKKLAPASPSGLGVQ